MPGTHNRAGGGVTPAVLPHHRTYGSASGGSLNTLLGAAREYGQGQNLLPQSVQSIGLDTPSGPEKTTCQRKPPNGEVQRAESPPARNTSPRPRSRSYTGRPERATSSGRTIRKAPLFERGLPGTKRGNAALTSCLPCRPCHHRQPGLFRPAAARPPWPRW